MATQKKMLEKENTFEGHPAPITNLAMGENGNIIVSSCEGTANNLIIWDRKTKNKLREMSFDGKITDIFLSPDETKCIVAYDKADNPDTMVLSLFNTQNSDDPIMLPLEKYREPKFCCLSDLAFHSNSNYVVYQIYNETQAGYRTNIFDMTTNKTIQSFRSDEPLLFAFNPRKTEIALAFKERVSLYDLNPFKKTHDLNFPRINKSLVQNIQSIIKHRILSNRDPIQLIFIHLIIIKK